MDETLKDTSSEERILVRHGRRVCYSDGFACPKYVDESCTARAVWEKENGEAVRRPYKCPEES